MKFNFQFYPPFSFSFSYNSWSSFKLHIMLHDPMQYLQVMVPQHVTNVIMANKVVYDEGRSFNNWIMKWNRHQTWASENQPDFKLNLVTWMNLSANIISKLMIFSFNSNSQIPIFIRFYCLFYSMLFKGLFGGELQLLRWALSEFIQSRIHSKRLPTSHL